MGARWRRMDVCGMIVLFATSVMIKPPCVIAEAGSRGVFQVNNVIGLSAGDSTTKDIMGGVGLEK